MLLKELPKLIWMKKQKAEYHSRKTEEEQHIYDTGVSVYVKADHSVYYLDQKENITL